VQPDLPEKYCALSVGGLAKGYFWQPITFQFLHGGIWHLLANLITIFFFGRPIEQALGPKRFLALYLGSGVFGGLLQLMASLLLPGHFGVGGVVGASAGAFGLVASFAALYPERPLTLLLFFVVPVSLRAKYLLLFTVLLALFGIVVPFDNIAHVAHLGGIAVGLALTWQSAAWLWPRVSRTTAHPLRRRELAAVRRGPTKWRGPQPPVVEELPPSEFISKEVDPILDKISAHGINSLTPRERRILDAASAKMDRR
jgi:membrane associated rhomboid family serine protease